MLTCSLSVPFLRFWGGVWFFGWWVSFLVFGVFFFVKKRKESEFLFGIKIISYRMCCLWFQEKGSEMTIHLMPPSSPYYFLSFALSWLCQCPLKPRGAGWVNAQWGEGVTPSITWAHGTTPNITQHLQQILHLLCITPECSKDFINSEGSKFFDKSIWRCFEVLLSGASAS